MRWTKLILAALIISVSCTVASAENAERDVLIATPYQMATRTYARGDYTQSRTHSLEACLHGEVKGCALLADMNRRGWGGPQDLTQAIRYYQQACEGGEASSCATLAHMYHEGSGIAQSFRLARSLYNLGCTGGEISACAAYGNMVYAGLGGPKDTNEGQAVLRLACRDDYEWACHRLWQYGLKR